IRAREYGVVLAFLWLFIRALLDRCLLRINQSQGFSPGEQPYENSHLGACRTGLPGHVQIA
ncbi:hypothetical protein, partial [Maricaulis sp.]|uniref:hypothetical protein n=1 Tax=Maricaulis sp. TaxID=1486257 RepID=UPI0025C3FC32